jgi:hypothetical protein
VHQRPACAGAHQARTGRDHPHPHADDRGGLQEPALGPAKPDPWDGNDADRLRGDPMFKLAMGRLPDDADLCSQPTISRLENLPEASGSRGCHAAAA